MKRLTFSCLMVAGLAYGANDAVVTGLVRDVSGKPVEHATVMVYKAGAKKGYSIYCPTCYPDCGKHAVTDAEGRYTLGGLNSDLSFTLLAVREGFAAAYVDKVNPANGPAPPAVLTPRAPVTDTAQVVRGLVVDAHGLPQRDAVVEQAGVRSRLPGERQSTTFGPVDWIDQMVVTNEKGEFEIAYGKPATEMILQVFARGMAAKLLTLPTGADRKRLVVTDGVTIRGRLMAHGEPVASAEIGIHTHSHTSGESLPEMLIGAREDGTFAITNVPAGRIWDVYPTMESLAARNLGAGVLHCETKDDGQEIDLGDILVQDGYSLQGKVVISGGGEVPPDMHVTLTADNGDAQFAEIRPDGSFLFRGLPPGVYSLSPAVRGYALPGRAREVLIQRDVSGVTLPMEPSQNRR